MTYRASNIGIVLDDFREASLFFDYVIPLFNTVDFPRELLPRGIYISSEVGNLIYDVEKLIPQSRRYPWDQSKFGTAQTNPDYYSTILPYLTSAIPKFIRTIEDKNSLCVPVLPDEYNLYVPRTGFEAISVVSTHVARVDASNLSWMHIKEFREDELSVSALRNYRLFWHDNYTDKSEAYAQDHLQMKYSKFRRACKKHGFDIVHMSLTNILQSKSMLSASAISLASVIAQEPLLGVAALASGIAVDVGKTTINIAKLQLDKDIMVKNSELAYLSKLEDKFT